jgi:hypothetical protein
MAEAMEGKEAQATLDRFYDLFPEVAAVFTRVPEAIADYKFILTEQQTAMMTGARQLAAVQSELDAGGISEAVRAELIREQRTYERALPIVALSMIKIDGIVKRLESGEALRRGERIGSAPPDAVLTPKQQREAINETLRDLSLNPRNQ